MHSLFSLVSLSLVASARAYFLVGAENFLTTERIDPIISPGKVSGHVHSVVGGSNFKFIANTESLRKSECTSMPIKEDKSAYWFPHLKFQWKNGSFTSVNGGAVIYYLFPDKPGATTAFPDDLRMISGNPTLRTYDPNSAGQKAISFLCLDFNGKSVTFNRLPGQTCPNGIRSQVNFPSCWDGKNSDSPDHRSHVAYRSGGPDSGECTDPKFPKSIPRIFLEVYWGTQEFDKVRSQAMDPNQPFVFSYGDRTGFGNHADFMMGWDKGVLEKVIDGCNCNIYGDATCCAQKGIFTLKKDQHCRITKSVDEATTGTLPKLPGNNPIQPEGKTATMLTDPNTPAIFSPVFAYTGNQAPAHGPIATPAVTGGVATPPPAAVQPTAPNAPSPSSSAAPANPPPAATSGLNNGVVVPPANPVVPPANPAPTNPAPTVPSPTKKPSTKTTKKRRPTQKPKPKPKPTKKHKKKAKKHHKKPAKKHQKNKSHKRSMLSRAHSGMF